MLPAQEYFRWKFRTPIQLEKAFVMIATFDMITFPSSLILFKTYQFGAVFFGRDRHKARLHPLLEDLLKLRRNN
jgi:hypothetical protein